MGNAQCAEPQALPEGDQLEENYSPGQEFTSDSTLSCSSRWRMANVAAEVSSDAGSMETSRSGSKFDEGPLSVRPPPYPRRRAHDDEKRERSSDRSGKRSSHLSSKTSDNISQVSSELCGSLASQLDSYTDDDDFNLHMQGDDTWQAIEHEKLSFLNHVKAHVHSDRGYHKGSRYAASDPLAASEDGRSAPSDRYSSKSEPWNRRYGRSMSSRDHGYDHRSQSLQRLEGPRHDGEGSAISSVSRRSGSSSRRSSSKGGGRRGDSVRSMSRATSPRGDIVHYSGPGNDQVVVDLQAKLQFAHRRMDEVHQRLRKEEHRARKAEKDLQAIRSSTPGGSDLEYQLMQHLVELRAKCKELDTESRKEESKYNEIENELEQERKKRMKAERTVNELAQKKDKLSDWVDELKKNRQELENQVKEVGEQNLTLQEELKLILAQRDEMFLLSERAVDQRDKEKKDKQQKLTEAERRLEQLRRKQKDEQTSLNSALGSMDQLLAKLDRNELETKEAVRELQTIRHGMRQLIASKAELTAVPFNN